MAKLVEIENVKNQLRSDPRKAICALYQLIFEEKGDRKNRSKLREFSCFTFVDESKEFNAKLSYTSGLSIGDLTSICNILGLNYSANKEQLRQDVIHSLMRINTLADRDDESEIDDDENDDQDTSTENSHVG